MGIAPITRGVVAEAYRRAVIGDIEPVYDQGKLVVEVKRKSDAALALLLKGLDKRFALEVKELSRPDEGGISAEASEEDRAKIKEGLKLLSRKS